ncbi:MAG: hypothetical protein IT223_05590 [Crocinitomicaceae bacterium]|nr:hypothetical protein [Crocinitomicaceae bacterium]
MSNGRMYAYCIISLSEEYYKLYTGNLVLAVDASCLESRLKNLIGMDINEIRKTFIETLCNDDFDMKGGAGLGLLTIAKRAKEKIQYRLSSLDEHLSYYQLEVKIPKI